MKQTNATGKLSAWLLTLLLIVCALPAQVLAQSAVSFREDFDYNVGDLFGQGAWVHYGANTADPIQVVDKSLTYEGYSDGTAGKCVKLGSTKSGEDLQTRFTDNDDGIKSGNIYVSALISVETQATGNSYVMGLVPRTKASVVAEGTSGTELGRLFLGKGDNDDEVKVGVERGGSKPEFSDTPLKIGQTYLIVLRYEINAANPKYDNVYLYINPASLSTEPETPSAYVDGPNKTGSGMGNYGLQGIELRQATNASNTAPELYVGALRIADSYTGLFGDQGEDKTPIVKTSKKSVVIGGVYVGDEYDEEITVTGTNLTGDITVTSSSPAVTVTPATITADEAMSGDGARLALHVTYTEGDQDATVTLQSEGATDVVLHVTWTGYTVPEISTIKALYSEDPEGGLTYRYSGQAVITFVDKGGDHPVYYLQDATAAIPVSDEYGILAKTYEVGDKITGTVFGLQSTFGTLSAVAFNTTLGKVVSQGNTVEPAEITLAALKAAPADYVSQLVRVSGVHFKDVASGDTFAEGMTQPVVTDGSDEANVRIFKKTTLIGTAIPEGNVTITGLSTSGTSSIIAPRGSDDIVTEEEPQEPALVITPEKTETVAGTVGQTSEVATFHVLATAMPDVTRMEITGTGKDQFSISTSEIAAGSSETDVVVSYTPTAVGKHRAYLMIDCDALPAVSKMIMLDAYAIDAQNPPTVTVSPATPDKFTAKVGEEQDQTITVTTSGLPDYAYVKVAEAGAFRVGSSMLLRNAENALRVTFAPTAAGTYSTDIIITTLGVDTVKIHVEGEATESQVDPEKEGDAFTLDATHPLTLLNETFDSVTERNKPFHLDGWTNAALDGTRAWWGYSFTDTDASAGEKVAKVTAYDSMVEEGAETPATMMLVTPALDFKNAQSKMFTFRVRGDYLADNQTDTLELCYIDLEDGEPFIAPVGGFTMPCTKDESGEWMEYHMDLDGQNLADVFFMGFRFKSARGRNNSATYYIDDVTYGRTDIPVVRPAQSEVAFTATAGKDATSTEIAVTTENLTQPVTLTLGGTDKAKFKLSTSQLEADGGTFTVTFNAKEQGQYEAYVKLASRGAADKYVMLIVDNTVSTSISALEQTAGHVTVYDLNGHTVADSEQTTPATAVSTLPAGIYVVKTVTDGSVSVRKVQR